MGRAIAATEVERHHAEIERVPAVFQEHQPNLASAIDLQVQLIQLQRRVQSRVPLPAMNLDTARLEKVLAAGKPILTFEQLPIVWSDLRFLVRSTADVMRTRLGRRPRRVSFTS